MRLLESTFVLLVFSALVACAAVPSENEMNYLGSALTKVSAAVDATARFKRSADTLIGAELLQTSTAHDLGLMKPFEGYTVRVLRDGRDTAVMICEPNNGRALLEDSGCSARLDVQRWSDISNPRCEFTVVVKKLCAR